MIRTPKFPSFNSPQSLTVFFFLPFLGFFIFAGQQSAGHLVVTTMAFLMSLGTVGYFYRKSSVQRMAIVADRQLLTAKLNALEPMIEKDRNVNDTLRRRIGNYIRLKAITARLGLSFSRQDAALVICSEINKIFAQQEHTVSLYSWQRNISELTLTLSLGGNVQIDYKNKHGDTYDRWTIRNMKPLWINDATTDLRFDSAHHIPEERKIGSLIAVPLTVGDSILGLLRVDSPAAEQFTAEDLRFLTTAGNISAVALGNAQLYERVDDLTVRDGLTGLYLQRYLWDRLAHETLRHLRFKETMALLMFDLDEFKIYSDRFGRMAGDRVLKSVSGILTDHFNGGGEIVSRYGSEKFCVLVPNCPAARAVELAESVCKRVESQTVIVRREKTKVTVSAGVACFPADARTQRDLVNKADFALDEAKRNGKNKVVAFSPGPWEH